LPRKDPDTDYRQAVALFRYDLIADLVRLQPGSKGLYAMIEQKAAGELWMSDVMHGPSVLVGERSKRKSYLIAFLDDATRVIPYAAFTLAENTATFLPVLKQAILRRGLPQRLYVDNGANYRSQHLALVCAPSWTSP